MDEARLCDNIYYFPRGDNNTTSPGLDSSSNSDRACGGGGAAGGVATSLDEDAPGVVVVFGWMNARTKHLQALVETYKHQFPTTSILLIRSTTSHQFTTVPRLASQLLPAQSLLLARHPPHTSPILLHIFSNGGCVTFRAFNTLFPNEIPARAILMDSCPGRAGAKMTAKAFTISLGLKAAKYPIMLLILFAYGLMRVIKFFTRTPSCHLSLYSDLTSILPRTPRLYLYSSKDNLISSVDVERHAMETRKESHVRRRVDLARFESTDHVMHWVQEKERYWREVKRFWTGTMERLVEDAKDEW